MINVDRVEKSEWSTLSEHAHSAVFQEIRPKEWDRIDYALLAVEDGSLYGYCTVRELDSSSIYLQYGGAFPPAAKSVKVYRAYSAFLAYFAARYRNVTTLVQNTNVSYLKLAMAFGFRIIGVRFFDGEIFVELFFDLTKGDKLCGQL